MIVYICKICNKEFQSSDKTRVTCSKECSNLWSSQIRKGQAPKNLNQWVEKGKSTRFQKGQLASYRLNLSENELQDLYVKQNLNLKQIGELKKCSPSTVLYYINLFGIPMKPKGFQKGNKVQSKEKHHKWKGGVTKFTHQIRRLQLYVDWRLGVFTRDNYTCQLCNVRGGKLHAHHIVTFSSILETYKIKTIEDAVNCSFLWDISNGIALCEKCHGLQHTKGEKDA